ncbi:hypothetical protein BASA83_006637 [Batrachochytrium salamandrivorans]|nr:hypothetical protein BASA83_006637 [Batrachochytrium salamandrivorans]
MQFFCLLSFAVVALHAAALPQPAGLSEKYSNSADTNLASGLEARSYQPALNPQQDSVTSMLLKRQDDSEGYSGTMVNLTHPLRPFRLLTVLYGKSMAPLKSRLVLWIYLLRSMKSEIIV